VAVFATNARGKNTQRAPAMVAVPPTTVFPMRRTIPAANMDMAAARTAIRTRVEFHVALNALEAAARNLVPRFATADVAQIESSPGGLFYMVTALFYVGSTLALWAWPMQNYYHLKLTGSCLPWKELWWVGAGLLIINAAAVAVPLWRGWRSLEKLER
jgi:hypothetical protein